MKKLPPRPERAKSIARWENEGGAGKHDNRRNGVSGRSRLPEAAHPKGLRRRPR